MEQPKDFNPLIEDSEYVGESRSDDGSTVIVHRKIERIVGEEHCETCRKIRVAVKWLLVAVGGALIIHFLF